MSVSNAQKKATAKYEAANYDKILLRLPKGIKEKIRLYSDTVNGYITAAVLEKLESDRIQKEMETDSNNNKLPFS